MAAILAAILEHDIPININICFSYAVDTDTEYIIIIGYIHYSLHAVKNVFILVLQLHEVTQ